MVASKTGFNSPISAKAFISAQIREWLASNPEFNAHPRIHWYFRDLPVADTNIGHLEWKIYRKVDDATGSQDPFTYWSVSITSDLQWIVFTHGNTDAGPCRPEGELVNASLVNTSQLTESGPNSLVFYLSYIVANFPPNHYGLT
jgi:hypothetical protein